MFPVSSPYNKLMFSYLGWTKKGTYMQTACFAMAMKYIYPKLTNLFRVGKNKEAKRENVL